MCFRYETCENCSVFDYWIPLTPLTSRQVSFSHRLLSRPPTSCVTKLRISQTQIPTSNNIYPLVIRKLTVLVVIISKWICPWAMFEARLVPISRGSPFPYLSSQRQWRTRFWWLNQRRIRIETALRKVARKISDEPTQSDRSIGPRLHLHLARANLTRQTGLKIECNQLELCGRTISIWANA